MAAALKAGIEEVPYDLVAERAGDEAGQYLDMILINAHRNPLTVLEEADALFAAKQAGATRTRLRKTTGMTPAAVNDTLAAARRTPGQHAQQAPDRSAYSSRSRRRRHSPGRLARPVTPGRTAEPHPRPIVQPLPGQAGQRRSFRSRRHGDGTNATSVKHRAGRSAPR